MFRAALLLWLVPLLGAASWSARAEDLASAYAEQLSAGEGSPSNGALGTRQPRLRDDLAFSAGYGHSKLALEIPFPGNGSGYSLCLLYDYARTDQVDPISGTGFTSPSGNDAHNLGLGLHSLVTERLEFEAVVGHSHTDSSSNSAYAGLIYNVSRRFGLGADLGRISTAGQDNNRLRAFARFYF